MTEPVDPGLLENVEVFAGDRYYSLMEGEALGIPHRVQVLTRGRGRERGATRIPIRLDVPGSAIEEVKQRNPEDMFAFLRELRSQGHLGDHDLERLELLSVLMPRPGNKLSGSEWDSPGGVSEPGEVSIVVAAREFGEEAKGLEVLTLGNPFPTWLQFASGAYDETQYLSFALVRGETEALAEGAREWTSTPLSEVEGWFRHRNDPSRFHASQKLFRPVDGKVVLSVMWLVLWLKHELGLD